MDSLQKIKNDFVELSYNAIPSLGINLGLPDKDNICKWKVTIIGASDSSYKFGLFFMEFTFQNDYPEKPPKIRFLTPIYHLNVNSGKDQELGLIQPILINKWWNSSNNIMELASKIFTLFYFQYPEYAFEIERAKEYKENKSLFEEKAKYFNQKYAELKATAGKFLDCKIWDFSYYNSNNFNKEIQRTDVEITSYNEFDKNDEFIILNFHLNIETTKRIKCQLKEVTRNVLHRFLKKCSIKLNDEPLLISNARRLNLDIPIGCNKIENNNDIVVITNYSV